MASRTSFSIKALFLGSWRNKLFAIFLAVVIWLFAYGNEIVKDTFEFEVKVDPTGEFIVVRTTVATGRKRDRFFDNKVTLTLSGQKSVLERFASDLHFAEFPVSPTGDGAIDLTDPAPYKLPGGVQIISAEPSAIACVIEKTVVRDIEVVESEVTPIAGDLDPGLGNPAFTFTPRVVSVSGPIGAFDGGLGSTTLAVTIDSLQPTDQQQGFSFAFKKVPVRLANLPQGYNLSQVKIVKPQKVDVSVRMESLLEERSLEDVPLSFVLPAEAYVSAPKKMSVKIRGPKSLLQQVEALHANQELSIYMRAKIELGIALGFELGELFFHPPLPPGVELWQAGDGITYEVFKEGPK